MRELAGVDVDDLVRQRADEIDIVADENKRALELIQREQQRVNARHVEVRGRFIHEQQVGRIQQQLHQREPAFFSTAQHADFLEHVVAAEQETAEQGADELLGDALRRVERLFQHGAAGIEHVHAILRVVSGFDVVAEFAFARLRRDVGRENLQQGGFSGAVRPDQHDALPALRLKFQAAINHVLPIGEINVLDPDDALAAALRLREGKTDLAFVAGRRFDFFHPVNLLELALRLRRLGRLGAETSCEVQQRPNLTLLIFVGGEELHFIGFALDEVIVVVAAIADEFALANLDDAADEAVEKFPVVRDDENRAGITVQIILKPQQRFEVEMVRRLVEHQQVRLLREQPGEVRAHDPAAAHFLRRPVKILFAKAETREDLLRLGLDLIAIQFVEAIVDIVVNFLRVQRLDWMIRLPGFDDAAESREFRRNGHRHLHHRLVTGGRAFLRQITDRDVALSHDLAVVRRGFSEDEGKERGLARAVRADQPEAVATIDLQRDVGKQSPSAVCLADAGKCEHEPRSIPDPGRKQTPDEPNDWAISRRAAVASWARPLTSNP